VFSRELIKERVNLSLLGTWGRLGPLSKLGRVPSPKHRKPRPTDFVKKELHVLELDKNFEKFTLEVLIGGVEGIEKNVTRPTVK